MVKKGKATGIDYLIQKTASELLTEDAGYPAIKLFDEVLYTQRFSIDEVVRAAIKVCNIHLNTAILDSTHEPIIYRTKLVTEPKGKKITLINRNNTVVASSPVVPPFTNISFEYKKVEYVQSGSIGKIYCRSI